jgi:arylsulfatase A-like enzyme
MAQPNLVFIFADNIGYGDWGCYGSRVHRTPHTDRMAAEGVRFTSFYSTSGVCTPSRASLMTGCYPRRINLHEGCNGGCVLRPVDPKGLSPDETTVARLLQSHGYATACVGKWHIGDQPPFLPTRHGFDYYYGIPYSDDMTARPQFPLWPELPLMRGEEVIEAPADRDTLTARYTAEACRFITEHRDQPFFLYLPHAMPGSTTRPFASPAFQGKSANGPYGDAIEEMDWSTGEILATLQRLGLDEQTLVVTTSDNGAVELDPPQGSNAPLRGWGYNTSEGAMCMPCVMRWPGRIAPGRVCDEVSSTLDVLPTFAALAGAPPPPLRIDGFDHQGLWLGAEGAVSQYDDRGFFYYFMGQLQAVRSGPWKLYLPLEARLIGPSRQTQPSSLALYDVRHDLGETTELSADNPQVVRRLLRLAEWARAELGDDDREGRGQRPAGWVEQPTARVRA